MHRRLLLFFLPTIYAPIGLADDASWNCAQSKDSKEWVCVGGEKIADEAPVIKEPIDTVQDSAAKETQPVIAEPVITERQPEPAENAGLAAATATPPPPVSAKTETPPLAVTPVTVKSELGMRLLPPAFDLNEEQIFGNLQSQLKYNPWQHCEAPDSTRPAFERGKALRESSPLDIKSDYAEVFDSEIYSYFGNVEMTRADQRSIANKASYDSVSETLDLEGSVYYSEDELALHGESASLNLASDQARLRDAMFISPSAPLRGRAKAVYRESDTLSRYKDVAYTSCRPGNQDWVVHASELKLNKAIGQGSAKNAWVEFKGTPVFYSPYLSFPTDDRRLSGFLAPVFGNTQRAGFSFSAPYYWNIAPNYDAVLKPRYLSKRGILLGGNFRYLTSMTGGTADVEFLPEDSELNKSRYLVALRNNSQFTQHIQSDFDLNYVSDKDYFPDLGNALSVATFNSFLLSQANVSYANEGVLVKGHVDNYQSIDKAITDEGLPYRRLPQVNVNLDRTFNFMPTPLNTLMDAEYVYFQHDSIINGQRASVKPSVSLPMQTASSYLTPKISLQHTQYLLSNPRDTAMADDSISRTLPIFSTNSGLYMEKDVNFSNRSYLSTLEPRLFYLYIPKNDQNDIPIFDTALNDFSFNSMFLDNRFSGTDRVQDANQLTAAVTTRLVDAKTGRDKMKFSLGETIYFRDREVTLPGYPVETSLLSPLVADLNAEMMTHVSMSSGVQWDPHVNDIVRHHAMLHYINQPGEIINVGYRYRKNTLIPTPEGVRPYDIIQSDASFHWPIYDNWAAVGRWTYSLLNNNTQESFFGLEKENCCWRFRVIGRRWINNVNLNPNPNIPDYSQVVDATGISQTGVFFQLELKGLTGVGEKLDDFFEQQIYGYRKPE